MRPGEGPKWTRPSPEAYKAKYRPLAAQYGISPSTVEVGMRLIMITLQNGHRLQAASVASTAVKVV
jgi:hypothetical protein